MDIESKDVELPSIEAGPEQEKPKVAETSEPVKALGTERNPEFIPQSTTGSGGQSAASSAKAASSSDDTQVINDQPKSSQPTSLVGQSPQIADDVDLIEKEWVEKAKEIVEKTKDNPYLQNKAISEIKADYIQKRYSKKIMKSDD